MKADNSVWALEEDEDVEINEVNWFNYFDQFGKIMQSLKKLAMYYLRSEVRKFKVIEFSDFSDVQNILF